MKNFPFSYDRLNEPLYNSRLINTYLEYLDKYYPNIDTDSLLDCSWINRCELKDEGHWLSQKQMDNFHHLMNKMTGDLNIPRKVGRYSASSSSLGKIREYMLSFMEPFTAYKLLGNISLHLTRASTISIKKLGSNKVEVISMPKPGVAEKPYQCENRIGQFEAVSKIFNSKFAIIEHPVCLHRGGDCCRYMVTWENSLSDILTRYSKYIIFICLLLFAAFYFIKPVNYLSGIVFMSSIFFILLILNVEYREKNRLIKNIKDLGGSAKGVLNQIDIRYNISQIIDETSEAISASLEIDTLLKGVSDIMEKRLDFDRGMILLTNKEKNCLYYNVGYGYGTESKESIEKFTFEINGIKSCDPPVEVYKKQRPLFVTNKSKVKKEGLDHSIAFLKMLGAYSFICVPIVYGSETLGVILVDNLSPKQSSDSNIHLLEAMASQIASGINNIRLQQKLNSYNKSEEYIREILKKHIPEDFSKRNLH